VSEQRNSGPRLVGGHPVIDLVNTGEPWLPPAARREDLRRPADLLDWAGAALVVDEDEAAVVAAAWAAAPAAAVRALHAAHDVREAAYAALAARLDAPPADPGARVSGADADRPGPDAPDPLAAMERLAMRWTSATARTDLVPQDPPGPPVRLLVGTDPAMRIPDRLAYAAVELLSGGGPNRGATALGRGAASDAPSRSDRVGRLRACPPALGGCGWLFLDHSRNGTRRWCAMDDCGARAKARRLTARRRSARSATTVG
jgi:hypothetical protein